MTWRAGSAMDGSCLGFGLLGPLLMTAAGTPMALGTPKQRAVLAVLLINRNRAVATDSLVDAAWDESPAPAVRASVHSYVSNLRRILGTAEVNPHAVLASAPPGYRLNVGDGDCDLDRFITKKTAGIKAAAVGQFEQASIHLSAALSEWRGPVLDDLRGFSFVEVFSTALMEENLWAHTARAESEIACGRAYAVIGELEELVAQHHYCEPLWAQLITAYYVAERQSEALEAYRRLKALLAEDLGIDPGPTIEGLQLRILRRERLDARQVAKTTAVRNLSSTHTAVVRQPAAAGLFDAEGRWYPLQAPATRLGRLADNDIVLDDAEVSRYHAVIIDTGSSFMITDLRSANGVLVQGRRLHPSAALADGDHISICGYEFTFELQRR
jgi:SARP family transcriptional regulator, regulator of embCAB operon